MSDGDRSVYLPAPKPTQVPRPRTEDGLGLTCFDSARIEGGGGVYHPDMAGASHVVKYSVIGLAARG